MNTATTADRVLLQPENRREERLLNRLFSHAEPPRCWWSYEAAIESDALDSMLAYRAAESDPPQAGVRALVIDLPSMEEARVVATSEQAEEERPTMERKLNATPKQRAAKTTVATNWVVLLAILTAPRGWTRWTVSFAREQFGFPPRVEERSEPRDDQEASGKLEADPGRKL